MAGAADTEGVAAATSRPFKSICIFMRYKSVCIFQDHQYSSPRWSISAANNIFHSHDYLILRLSVHINYHIVFYLLLFPAGFHFKFLHIYRKKVLRSKCCINEIKNCNRTCNCSQDAILLSVQFPECSSKIWHSRKWNVANSEFPELNRDPTSLQLQLNYC